jgi:hypothetical protein
MLRTVHKESFGPGLIYGTYVKDEQMVVLNYILGLLWTGGGSSISSVAF